MSHASVSVTVNGQVYSIPQTNERGWGAAVTSWIQAISNYTIQPTGGTFTLTSDLDFGATYGLKSNYYKSRSSNISTAGIVRVAVGDSLGWRNNANSGNLLLSVNGSNLLTFNGNVVYDASQTVAAATNTTNTAITDDTTTNATMYPTWVTANTGNLPQKVSSTKITFNPSTANLTTTTFTGALAGNSTTATTATNLAGGSGGVIPYQSAAGTTALLANGTAGQVLSSQGTTLAPQWIAAPGGVDAWVTSRAYVAGNVVTNQQNTYICLTNHTSGTFVTDVAAAKWVLTGASALQSPNLMQVGNTFEDNTVGGWVAVGGGAVTNGLITTVGSGGTVYISGNGGVAKNANTTAAAVTSSSPIDGTYSLNLATSGAGAIGDGYISQSIPISTAYQAKVLTVKFKYKVASGTPVMGGTSANTYAADVYDVTNNTWLRLVGNFNFVQSTGVGDFVGTVQTASTTAAIQLFVYSPVAPAASSSLLLDNFYIGQQTAPTGPAMSDWVAYTPTFSAGFGTVSAVNIASRRVGDSLEIHGTFTAGTVAASVGTMTIGYNGVNSAVTVDTTKIAANSSVGFYPISFANTTTFGGYILAPATSVSTVQFGAQTSTAAGTAATNISSVLTNSAVVEINLIVPIVGWSSNTVQSSDTDTRVIAARYAIAGAVSLSTTQPVDYSTKIFDTSGSVTTGASWKFTAPVTGYYRVSTALAMGTSTCTLVVYKNGSLNAFLGSSTTTTYGGGSATVQLNAGDYIDVRSDAAAQNTNASTSQIISIERLSGPAVISATESVSATYTGTATGSLSAAYNLVTWPTKQKDTHNAYSSGTYTVPVSGTYNISASLDIAAVTFAIANYNALAIQKNGSNINEGFQYTSVGAPSVMPRVSVASYPLVAGDLITIKSYSAATTPSFGGGVAGFSIVRVGN